jgi:hypothetical protein
MSLSAGEAWRGRSRQARDGSGKPPKTLVGHDSLPAGIHVSRMGRRATTEGTGLA